MSEKTLSKIMVVDDDPDILSQLEKIFAKLNIQNVKTFTLAQDIIKELENSQEPYDCLFIDVKMPVMSGVALIQHIKAHKDKKISELFCIPIVGTVTKEDTIILQELNCNDTVSKPLVERVFIEKFKELIKTHQDPLSDKNFLLNFQNALLDKKFNQAELLLLPKIKAEPNSVKYLGLYAELLMKAKNWEKAEEFLNKVLKIDPNYIPALNLISKVYIKSGRFDEAMRMLEKAKSLSPLHIDRLLVMGEMNLGAGSADKAEENFRSALKINPMEEKAAFGLGRALATLGRVEESKKILSGLSKGAELASFFNNKGVLLVRAKKISEGISLYQNALKVMDDKEREHLLLYNIALAYSKIPDLDQAIQFAKKSIERSPENYIKPKALLEKLEKDKNSNQQPSVDLATSTVADSSEQKQDIKVDPVETPTEKKNDFIFTQNQVEFIMGGFDMEEAAKPQEKKEEKKTESKSASEEEFITFGL